MAVSFLNITLISFFTWVLISKLYSPSVLYSAEKANSIIYNTLIPIFVIFCCYCYVKYDYSANYLLEKYFFYCSVSLTFCCFFLLFFLGTTGPDGRATLPGIDNPIWVSRFFGMLTLVMLLYNQANKSKWIFFPVILLGFFCMFYSGSRTPLVALILVMFVKFAYEYNVRIVFKRVFPFTFIFLIAYFINSDSYIFDTDFYSLHERFGIFSKLLADHDWKYFLGYGLGSFGVVFTGNDVNFYPHNVFIEIFFEMGIIGLSLFTLVLYFFCKRFAGGVISYLTIYYFILSLTSGDIPGNNVFFVLLFVSGLSLNKIR